MKAKLDKEGTLIIRATTHLESYALDTWIQNRINGCTGNFKEGSARYFFVDTRVPKITLFHRIKLRIQLFFYR